jgi:hypothetical protein
MTRTVMTMSNAVYSLKIRFCREWFSLVPGYSKLGYFHWMGFQFWWEVEK